MQNRDNHTGIIRTVDKLGRVTLPAGMRKLVGIGQDSPVEMMLSEDGRYIMISRYTGNLKIEALLTDALYMLKGRPDTDQIKQLKYSICDALDICQRLEDN